MGKESRVEIPSGSGNFYRYSYDQGSTNYLGPVGSAPDLGEQEFLLTLSEIERKPIEERVKVVLRKRKGYPSSFDITERGFDIWHYFTDWGEKGNVIIVNRLDRHFIEETIRIMQSGEAWHSYQWGNTVDEDYEVATNAFQLLVDEGWVRPKTTKGTIINPNVGTRPEVREFEESHSPWR